MQTWARQWKQSRDIGLPLELLTGGAAGGLAGVITCPLDVVKTRIQTQVNSSLDSLQQSPPTKTRIQPVKISPSKQQKRSISTSSPSTHTPRPGSIKLDTSSVPEGLKIIYKTEGLAGWFRGVGPRFVWTSVQSGCMLFLYQSILRQLENWQTREDQESNV